MEAITNFIEWFSTQWYITFIKDNRWELFVEGLGNTIFIALVATVIGISIGMLIAIIKVNYAYTGEHKWLNKLCNFYLTVIRGTPIVIQLMIMMFVIFVSVSFDKAIYVAILAFGINSGAYVAEIIRAGIMSIDKGQMEAGTSLGLSSSQTMRLIILPQAVKNVLPALFNEFITLLKETSVVGYVTIKDITRAGDIVRTRTYSAFFPLIVVALIYLTMVVGLTKVQERLERRLAQSDNH